MATRATFSSCSHGLQPPAFACNRNAPQRRFSGCPHGRQASVVASAYPSGGDGDESDVKSRLKESAELRMEEILSRIESTQAAGPSAGSSDEMMSLRQSIQSTVEQLTEGLVERDTEARLMLLAAMSGEHVLFLGPPGTAKSELSRRLHQRLSGTSYFERLLTRFSVPEELFGPLSMRALEQDMYLRDTEGYLPTAEVAFIDEVFKANSAILNTLLTILNERLFDNGKQRLPVPLLCLVAASNELPESEELDALYDRFLLRAQVKQVSPGALSTLLSSLSLSSEASEATPTSPAGAVAEPLTVERARSVREKAVAAVAVPQSIVDVMVDLRTFMQDQLEPPSYVSDRRLVKALAVMQVAAYTDGRSAVHPVDTLLLRHMIWSRPEDAEAVHDWLVKRLAMQAGDEKSVNYVLSSLFGRTCHALQDEEKLTVIKNELSSLREAVEETLKTENSSSLMGMPSNGAGGDSAGNGGPTPGGPLNSLWLSTEDSEAVGEALMPRIKKARESLLSTLFEVVVLERAVEMDADAVVLAEVMPRYWADFIRNTTVEEAKSMGGTRPRVP